MGDRLVAPTKPDNASGGRGPKLKIDARRSKGQEIGVSLATLGSAQKRADGIRNILLRGPDAGNPPVRFDESEVETETGSGS